MYIIEQSLRNNSVPIDAELWKMLSRFFLCGTPADELLHRLNFAKVVKVPSDAFAAHLHRMLRCLLLSSPVTKHMKLTYVDGEHLHIVADFLRQRGEFTISGSLGKALMSTHSVKRTNWKNTHRSPAIMQSFSYGIS